MEEHHKLKQVYFSSSRIEALTDGIFAFAMTLLVLNLNAPILHGLVTNQDLLNALNSLGSRFFTFLLSFFLLASAWGVHHRQFSFIKRSDTTLMWINMVRMLFVIMVPFSSVLVGTYPNLSVAVFFFSANILLLSLVTYVEWKYAVTHDLTEGVSPEHKKSGDIKNAFPILVSGVACLVSLFQPEWALWAFAIIPFGMLLLKKLGKII